jgi:hypothetical protein
MADNITRHPNDANYIVRHLSTKPNDALTDFDEQIAFLSTPFKRLGIQGWTQTGCSASGYGKPVREAQWSTDQFNCYIRLHPLREAKGDPARINPVIRSR